MSETLPTFLLLQVLRRVWCLFEIWKTVDYHDVDGLVVVATDVDLIRLKVGNVDTHALLLGVMTKYKQALCGQCWHAQR